MGLPAAVYSLKRIFATAEATTTNSLSQWNSNQPNICLEQILKQNSTSIWPLIFILTYGLWVERAVKNALKHLGIWTVPLLNMSQECSIDLKFSCKCLIIKYRWRKILTFTSFLLQLQINSYTKGKNLSDVMQ